MFFLPNERINFQKSRQFSHRYHQVIIGIIIMLQLIYSSINVRTMLVATHKPDPPAV